MTEAEQLANELTEAVECFPEPTRLETEAAAMLRSQAAEIERLKAEANTCGAGAGCCAQAAEIERLKAEAELFAKHVGLKLARKDALLRCIYDNTTMADWPADIEERIEKELGE